MEKVMMPYSSETPKKFSKEDMQNASALLAMMNGKSDSICRVFDKQIKVDKNQLKQLHLQMLEKLSLHEIIAITTNASVTLTDRRIISFKTWEEFEAADFSVYNAKTQTIFIQWDFLAQLNYTEPQRHTVSIRISSPPSPSDVFKMLLHGGFDENQDLEVMAATLICSISFVNNTLAEELLHVVEIWNDCCESALKCISKLSCFMFRFRKFFLGIFEVVLSFSLAMLFAIGLKVLLIIGVVQTLSVKNAIFGMLFVPPIYLLIRRISYYFKEKLSDKLDSLMSYHIFNITKGDAKEKEKANKKNESKKEVVLFVLNILFAIALAAIFKYI